MKKKLLKILFIVLQIMVLMAIIATLFVGPGYFVGLKIYNSMIFGSWAISSILLIAFSENKKAAHWCAFLLGLAAMLLLFPFSAWAVLSLISAFGGYDWLMYNHLTIEDFFPGYLTIVVSWPALIAAAIFIFFSFLLKPKEDVADNKSETISAKLKENDERHELGKVVHQLMEEEEGL